MFRKKNIPFRRSLAVVSLLFFGSLNMGTACDECLADYNMASLVFYFSDTLGDRYAYEMYDLGYEKIVHLESGYEISDSWGYYQQNYFLDPERTQGTFVFSGPGISDTIRLDYSASTSFSEECNIETTDLNSLKVGATSMDSVSVEMSEKFSQIIIYVL